MHMAVSEGFTIVSESHSFASEHQAFYNPSPNGGIERTSRAADVNAPSARFPFEVSAIAFEAGILGLPRVR